MEDFRKACGMVGLLRLEVRGGGGAEARSLALNRPFAVIGSDPSADLHLDDRQVSRRHAYLQAVAGRVFCVDLGSRTGILREDGRLQGSGWLPEGEDLQIGPYLIRLVEAHDDGRRAPGDGANPLEEEIPHVGPEVVLNAVDGGSGPISSKLRKRLTLVGGSLDCRIRLRDPSISRVHCALLCTDDGIWAVDLLGRRGISMNGRRARSSRFEEGDWLQIGRFVLARPRENARRELATLADSPAPAPWRMNPDLQLVTGPEAGGDADTRDLLPPNRPGGVGWEDPTALLLANQFAMMQRQMFDQFGQMFRAMIEMMGENQREQMAQVREEVERLRELGRDLAAGRPPLPPPPPHPRNGIAHQGTAPRPEGGPATGRGPTPTRDRDAAPDPEGPREEALDWVCRRILEIQGEQQTGWQRLSQMLRGAKPPRNPAEGDL